MWLRQCLPQIQGVVLVEFEHTFLIENNAKHEQVHQQAQINGPDIPVEEEAGVSSWCVTQLVHGKRNNIGKERDEPADADHSKAAKHGQSNNLRPTVYKQCRMLEKDRVQTAHEYGDHRHDYQKQQANLDGLVSPVPDVSYPATQGEEEEH